MDARSRRAAWRTTIPNKVAAWDWQKRVYTAWRSGDTADSGGLHGSRHTPCDSDKGKHDTSLRGGKIGALHRTAATKAAKTAADDLADMNMPMPWEA